MDGGRSLRNDIDEVLVTEAEIEQALARLAAQITVDLGDCNPILVGVLTGAFIFLGDLVRRLDFPLEIEFICAHSYGDGTHPGDLVIEMDLRRDIADRHVLLVDDILDTGQTLKALVQLLQQRGPKSVRTCCLLDKPSRRTVEFAADYIGLTIPDRFVVGYGLDFAHHHRNLPFIGVLRPELYEKL